jgi:phage head maturation protease
MDKTTQVGIKTLTDSTVTVAGYGVVYGGTDLEGEQFGPDTDFMLDLVPAKLVLYDHGAQLKHVIGKTANVVADDYGLWVEAELDRHAEYVKQIETLVEKGALGWSSGSVGHLARRAGKSITAWPIVEFSLTPTPAEPRTLGVDVIKSLAETDSVYAALLPEGDGESPEQDAQDEDDRARRLAAIDIEILELENRL